MTKEQVIQKVKDIVSKDQYFNDVKIKIIYTDKKTTRRKENGEI